MAIYDWNRVAHLKPEDMTDKQWRKSYDGVKAALETLDIEIRMTEADFDLLEGPPSRRKVVMARAGSQRQHTAMIGHVLTRNTCHVTDEERAAIYLRNGARHQVSMPKGKIVTHDTERDATNALNHLLSLSDILVWEHLWENRLADVAYKHPGAPGDAYVPDQVKSARVQRSNALTFHTSIKEMVDILEAGMSLTLIGMNVDSVPKKAWFLTPTASTIADLKLLPNQLTQFQPRLALTRMSSNPITKTMSAFAYHLTKPQDVVRLRQAKVAFVDDAPMKRSLSFWNEDPSQIPCANHQREMESKSF